MSNVACFLFFDFCYWSVYENTFTFGTGSLHFDVRYFWKIKRQSEESVAFILNAHGKLIVD